MTEALWYAVTEAESLFSAKLAHAVMIAALYGNPSAKLDDGNDQIHEMYLSALNTLPYFEAVTRRKTGEAEALVDEWRKMNAASAESGKRKEGSDVHG